MTLKAQIEVLQEENTALRKEITELKRLLQEALDKLSKNSLALGETMRRDRTKSLRISSGKKAGGQPGHRGTTLQFSETPDTIIEHPASVQCSGCGEDISNIESLSYQRRQVYDFPL